MGSHDVLDVKGVIQLFCSFLKSVLFKPVIARQAFENEDGHDWYVQHPLFLQVLCDIFQVRLFQTTHNHLVNPRGLINIYCKQTFHNRTEKVSAVVSVYEEANKQDEAIAKSPNITNHIK